MKKSNAVEDSEEARYEFACKARELELNLFWQRSLFFWGFIAAAFVAFADLRERVGLSVLIAGFGFVCSVSWTLANRGSKFWYESWEQKLKKSEKSITGEWFGDPEPRKIDSGFLHWWLEGRRFSVSKLAIALSDYVTAVWLILLVSRLVLIFFPSVPQRNKDGAITAFAVASLVYAIVTAWRCHVRADGEQVPSNRGVA